MKALIVNGASDVRIDLDVASISQRDNLIQRAESILSVADAVGANAAAQMVRELRAMSKDVETTRMAVKEPVLQLGRQIDAMAKEFVAPIALQSDRISRLLTTYNVEQDRIRREEEAKRQQAIRDAQEAERKAREEAEAAKRKAEAEAAAAAKAEDPFAQAEAEAEAVKAAEEAKRRADEATRARTVVASAPPPPVAANPAGVSTRSEPNFRINDLLAFANARPDLVTITPKRAEILAEMRKMKEWEGEQPLFPFSDSGRNTRDAIAIGWWERKAVVR